MVVMKVMHLIDALDYSGSAQQLRLLGPALAHTDVSVAICCLGPSNLWEERLRQEGVAVHNLAWTRWFDPSVLWRLREVLRRAAPDVIHVWRLPALRALAVVAQDLLSRVVMSAPLPPKGRLAWWDRCLLQRVRCLAVAGVSDQQRCLQQGLVAPSLRVVSPAVADAEPSSEPPADAPTIVCIGKLERDEGFRQAIWAFDIVRQSYADAQLILVGAGSQRETLQALAEGLETDDRVHFLGAQADLAPLLHTATCVWIPSSANCGRQVALDAMARGCVVIASAVPCLREVVRDGETGYLVPVGEVVPIARHTHALLQDDGLLAHLSESARRHVALRFSLEEATQRWREVYRSLAT
jgi:glycosyltransferase involved in cell wall biosynthesis